MFEWTLPSIYELASWLFGGVIVKYIITKAIATELVAFFKYCFVRTQRHIVIYIHYREKAMKKGHDYPTPELCDDGVCKSYRAKTS